MESKLTSNKPHQFSYMPILKGKAGEFGALKELSTETKSKIIPLIEIPPVPWDYTNERESKTIENHILDTTNKLMESWNCDFPIAVDVELVEKYTDEKIHVLEQILNTLFTNGINAVPVLRLSERTTFDVIKKYKNELDRIILRVNNDNINEFEIESEVDNLIKEIGIDYENIDLLVDFEYIKSDQVPLFLSYSRMVISSFPNIDRYKTFTLGMGSFPSDLSEQESASTKAIMRNEWEVWNSLISSKSLKRIPRFSDYAITNPVLQDIDPRIMQMSANIRYTTEDSWFVLKGKGVKRSGFEQFYYLAKHLVYDSGKYYGEQYSWGDGMIMQKANRIGGTGNATTWRQIGTNHHLQVTVNLLNAISPSF